jgi:hypothetical protein
MERRTMARKRQTETEPWEQVVEAVFETADFQDLLTMANGYFNYYSACRKAGFTEPQAMELVRTMQTQFLINAYAQQQKGE